MRSLPIENLRKFSSKISLNHSEISNTHRYLKQGFDDAKE